MDVTETDMKSAELLYTATKTLCDMADEKIIPVLKALLRPTDHDQALTVTYYRVQMWLYSLEKLDDPKHFQAVMNAARRVYELLIDLKFLQKFPSTAAQFHSFPFVVRFRAAENYVKALNKYPNCPPPVTSNKRQVFVADVNNQKKFADEMRTHWPSSPKPPDHWSGLNLPDRAERLSPRELIRYRYVYAQCCWFVHSGSAGVADISAQGLLHAFCWGHEMIQVFFVEASEILADAHKLYHAISSLRQDLDSAKNALPQSLFALDPP